MKLYTTIVFSLLMICYTSVYSQIKTLQGARSTINIALGSVTEYYRITSNSCINTGFSSRVTFSNKYFIDAAFHVKANTTHSKRTGYTVNNQNVQVLDLSLGYKANLGLTRNKSGRFVPRKTQVVFTMTFGVGRLREKPDVQPDDRFHFHDYFTTICPYIGMERIYGGRVLVWWAAGYKLVMNENKLAYPNSTINYDTFSSKLGVSFFLIKTRRASVF